MERGPTKMTTTATVEFTPVTHTLTRVRVGLRDRIDAKTAEMAKRLARLDAPAPTVEYGPIVEEVVRDSISGHVVARYDVFETVTVTGYNAKFAGWTPIASLDWTFSPDEGYASYFPGVIDDETGEVTVTLPDTVRTGGPTCGHCGLDRDRNLTIAFHGDDGTWLTVGTSCVRDFIGVNPNHILWLVESTSSFEDLDDEETGGRYDPVDAADATYVVSIAAMITRSAGFVPSKAWDNTPTRDHVADVLRTGDVAKYKGRPVIDVDWDREWAATRTDEIVAWVAAKAASGYATDYIRNAHLALTSGRTGRALGLLVSLPAAYDKAMAAAAEKAAVEAALPTGEHSRHLGEIGDKIVVAATIVKAITVETMYGTSKRVTAVTDDGDKVTTFGSGATLFGVDRGDRVEWRGTVKAHNATEEWGVETEFARVKLLDPPSDVDFTRVAKKGDTVAVTVPTDKAWDLEAPRSVPDGWVYDGETGTLYTVVEKVKKVDDRFVYETNAPTGWFRGDEITVIDPADVPAWRIDDAALKREARTYSHHLDDTDVAVLKRKIGKWYEARGVTDPDVDADYTRYLTLSRKGRDGD